MGHEIYNILNDMSEYFNITQMKRLQEVLLSRMKDTKEEVETIENITYKDIDNAVKAFLENMGTALNTNMQI